jgi:hypothetical protein
LGQCHPPSKPRCEELPEEDGLLQDINYKIASSLPNADREEGNSVKT